MEALSTASNISWPSGLMRPEDVDGRFLEEVLSDSGHEVTISGVRYERVGAGQIGDTARFHITYTSGRAGPATLIGKFASSDETSRAIAAEWSLYEREVLFYRTLADKARISTPKCYGAAMRPDGAFVLLLEDLSPAQSGDQFRGIAKDDAERAMREAARLHAAFWEQGDDPALAWLDTGPKAQPFYGPEIFQGTWPQFRERYSDRLETAHISVCDRLFENYDAYNRPRTRIRCVTHNDYRPDNMLLDHDRLTVVDWQSVALGTNAVDISYLIGGSYSPEARREIEPFLIDAYLEELRAQGVASYEREEFMHDYRHFTFAGINVAVGAAMLVQRTERGDRMFLTMLDRHVAHVCDSGALDLLAE